jgi:hypothetical protein
MYMLYKSCSVFHQESNKIGFEFFWIFYSLLRILQESANQQHYWRYFLQAGPWKESRIHRYALSLHLSPWKE